MSVDDRDDDRPRRRRRDDDDDYDRPRKKGGGSTLTILLVVGGLIFGVVAVCGGVVAFGIFQFKKAADGLMAAVGPSLAAESFLGQLKAGQPAAAYDLTTAGYQARTSKPQFEAFVAKHPILSKHGFHDSVAPPNLNPPAPGKPVVMTFTLHAGPDPDAMDDEPDEDTPPPTKPAAKKSPPTAVKGKPPAPALKDATVTLTLLEENGAWKVDDIQLK